MKKTWKDKYWSMRKLYLAEKRWNENTRAQYSDMHEKGRKLWMAIATENVKISNPDYPVPPENPFTTSNKSLPPKTDKGTE